MTIEVQESSSTALNWLGMFLSDVLWECKVNAYLSAGHPRPKRRSTNPAFQFAGRRQFLLMLFCDPTNRLGQCVCFARSRSPPTPTPCPSARLPRCPCANDWKQRMEGTPQFPAGVSCTFSCAFSAVSVHLLVLFLSSVVLLLP